MKRLTLNSVLFFSALVIVNFSWLHAQSYRWAATASGSSNDYGYEIANDPDGNVFTAGTFYYGPIDFDPGAGVSPLTSSVFGMYLQALDSARNFLWAKGWTSGYAQIDPNALTTDLSGNTVLSFRTADDTIDLDPGAGTFTNPGGSHQHYVVKLDPSGNFLWADTLHCLNIFSVGTDASGNILVGGDFYGTIDFDPGPGVFNLTGANDGFVLKLDPSGNFLWAGGTASTVSSRIIQVSADPAGNIISSGYFNGTCDFDPGAGTASSTTTSGYTAFVLKLNSSGAFDWVKTFEGAGPGNFAVIKSLATDASGNVCLAGTVTYSVDFDPGPGAFMISSADSADIFVCKLSPSGNLVRAISFFSMNYEEIRSMTLNSSGEFFLTGYYSASPSWDADPGPGTYPLSAPFGSSPFVIKLDSTSNFIWAFDFDAGASGYAYTHDISVDPGGGVYCTGYFSGTVDFNPGAGVDNYSAIFHDPFIMKVREDACSTFVLVIDSVLDNSCTAGPGITAGTAYGGVAPYTWNWSTTPVSTDSFAILPAAGIYSVTVSDAAGCSRTRDILCNGPAFPSGADLRVSLISQSMVRGDTSMMWLDGMNDGCVPVSGNMYLVVSAPVSYYSSTPPPDAIAGDTLKWFFTSFTFDSPHLIPVVQVITDALTPIGDTVCFAVGILPLAGDANITNNFITYCDTVRAAFDPNDKQVQPQGVCAEHFVKKDEALTYTIRFQNTGSAPAENVYILDSLDSDLELSTISVKSHSHAMHTEILPGNVLKFVFNHINLPDSGADEPNSHGYVIYEITPKTGLPDGTQIYNGSAIYFDFNPAVLTNVVMNTLMDSIPPCTPSEIAGAMEERNSVRIYPNPATTSFTVESSAAMREVRVMNMMGQEILHRNVQSQSARIETSGWTPGVYVVVAATAGGNFARKIVIR